MHQAVLRPAWEEVYGPHCDSRRRTAGGRAAAGIYRAVFGGEEGLPVTIAAFQDGLSFISDYKPVFDIVFIDIKNAAAGRL